MLRKMHNSLIHEVALVVEERQNDIILKTDAAIVNAHDLAYGTILVGLKVS